MESSEVGLYKSRKRKEPNELQSEKQNTSDCNESKRRKEPHVYLNEHIGHVTETTSKTKKVVPESSLGRDLQLPSPPKGNSVVILALNAVSEGNKTVQSKNKTSKSKNNNVVQDMVEKERAASKITEVHEEVCESQKKLKKKPSERRKKIVVESGSEKLSETLITNRSDQNLSEQKSERVDGKISIKLLVAAEANQKIDHDTLCNIQRKDVQRNKSSEPASETAELHEEVCVQKKLKKKVVSKNKIINSSKNNNVVQDIVEKERAASETADKNEEVCVQKKLKKSHCKRRKKSAAESGSEKLSETLVTKHSDQQKVDDSPFCKFENKDDQVGEGVGSESQGDDKKDVCLMRKKRKRKEKRQTDKINKNTWERGCQDVSDTSDTKGLGLDNSVPATFGLALARKEKINEVLSDCLNINSTNNDYLCNENETSLVDLQSSKTHRRKDKTVSLGKMESRIDKTRFEASFDSLNASENKGGVKLKGEDDICQKVILADSYTEEENLSRSSNFFPDVNIECSKDPKLESGRNRKETQMEVSESTHQDKTLNDHLPQENGGISRKVQKTKPDDVSYSNTLEVMSERGNPSGLCRKDYDSLSQNDKVLSVDESLTNQSNKRSVSKKKRRKKKTKHTSDQANASDNLSTSDPSAKHHCSFSEGAIEASCNNCGMEETSPSAGDIRKEVIIVATESTKDELHNRSASPGTGQIMQSSRKLLILDLNGLLVDIVSVLPKGCIADKRIGKRLLIKRPFCDDFVKFCFETFNVGVWSSRTKINVDKVVDFIMGDYRHKLLFCWHQSQCTPTGFNTIEAAHKPMVCKEIKKLWDQRVPGLPWNKGDYNESNTLLLDDSPYKALLNPPCTAIFPDSYKCWNANDNALGPGGKIREYLEGIATAEDVQKYVEHNPFGQRAVTSRSCSWGYYLRIIRANRFCLPT